MVNDPPNKLRVMVDANVFVAGSGWPRFPYEVLQHAVAGDYLLVLSPRIIQEARTSVARIGEIAAQRFEDVLEAIQYEEVSTPSDEAIADNQPLSRDAKDVHVAVAAVTAKMDCLVTSDKDLTESEPLKALVTVLLPPVFLRDYMGWTSEELEAIRLRNWQDLKNQDEEETKE